MDLVPFNSEVLWTPAQEFDFQNPPFDPIAFAHEFVAFMMEKKGYGLAAPQIGVPYSIFAMRGEPQHFVMFNPRIVHHSHEKIELDEGCLSFPNLIVKVTRPQFIRVRFNTPNGETLTKQFINMSARCVQHEVDHLNGDAFYASLSRLKLTNAIKAAKKRGSYYEFSDLWKLAHKKERV